MFFPVAFLIKSPLPELLLGRARTSARSTARRALPRDPLSRLGTRRLRCLVRGLRRSRDLEHRRAPPPAAPSDPRRRRRRGRGLGHHPAGKSPPPRARPLAGRGTGDSSIRTSSATSTRAVGGWRNGWRWLADSNVDWGQNLVPRLARWTRKTTAQRSSSLFLRRAEPAGLRRSGHESLERVSVRRACPPHAGRLRRERRTELLGLFLPAARDDSGRPGTTGLVREPLGDGARIELCAPSQPGRPGGNGVGGVRNSRERPAAPRAPGARARCLHRDVAARLPPLPGRPRRYPAAVAAARAGTNDSILRPDRGAGALLRNTIRHAREATP